MFDRNGTCLYYTQWQGGKSCNMPKEEEEKLMYGMLFSLKSFVTRMSPTYTKDVFVSYTTSKYKLHFMESPTGVKIVLNTDLNVGTVNEYLHNIYKLYVDYVVKNAVTELGEILESELFTSKLNSYVQSLPIYT